MKRIVKAPNERRQELLDRARELFFHEGYDRTSVEAIISAASVSKGAFYHYFESKEALLESLADGMVDESLAKLSEVLDAPFPDALTRLQAFWAASRPSNVESAGVVRRMLQVVLRPENLPLRSRINSATISKVAPVLAKILEQGMQEDVFAVTDPHGTAEMLLHLGLGVHDSIARALEASEQGRSEIAAETLQRRLDLFEVAFNRVLGLEDHAVLLHEPGFAKALLCDEVQR